MSLEKSLEFCINGESEKSYQILKKLNCIEAQFNLGWHELRKGNLQKGMEGLSIGRWLNVFGSPPLKTNKKIWKDQSLVGKKILLRGEGGYGDEIINVRFAENFKNLGAEVTVSCSPSLFGLFRQIPFIDNLIHRDGSEYADFDYWVPAMSAPLVLGLEYEHLSGKPYIPRNGKTENGLSVGLKFSGNPKFEHEQHRKFTPELMTGLQDIPCDFYSLQKDDVPELGNIKDLSEFLTDWNETSKIISGLDLVITSCTSIAHLSGAMGIETWVIVPIMPYYIWALPGDKSPWYDSVTLYRQEKYGSWKEPFEKIRKDLNDFRQNRQRQNPLSVHRKAS